MPSIAVITATLNAREHIEGLASSLMQQIDQDFVWVVADGASNDGTVEYLQGLRLPQLTISVKEDFGIYDAINRALKLCSSDYYVVAGSDDYFFSDAISKFKRVISADRSDIFVFNVNKSGLLVAPRKRPVFYSGHKSIVAEHSVSTLFRLGLHNELGYYSNKYPIAADHDFILRCYFAGSKITRDGASVGVYAGGISFKENRQAICESFLIQSKYFGKISQTILAFARILFLDK